MANKSLYVFDQDTGDSLPLKLIDNGDGTFSLSTSGTSGGASTVADGANVTLGAKADSVATTDTGTFSFIALFKRLLQKLTAQLPEALGSGTLAQSLPINEASDILYDGTKTLSTTGAALAASQAVREVIVQNDPDNTIDVFIGNSTSQSIQLKPGQSVVIPVSNLATVFAKSASGTPVINYLGRS